MFFLASTPAHVGETAHHAAHSIPLPAEVLFHWGPVPITNSMIVLWIVTFLLVGAATIATRKVSMVPSGFQNFFEFLIESLFSTLEGILGPHLTRRTFWFFATIFITILTCNWMGLLPFFGSVYAVTSDGVTTHRVPFLRAATADLNLPLAMATVYFFLWLWWSLTEVGPWGMIKHVFGSKGGLKANEFGFPLIVGRIIIFMVAVIFFFVGLIEVLSILFRQVSLPIRLFGNVFAGENLMHAMSNFFGGWLITIPFYALEILVGFVQALVFMLLTAVFTNLMCGHEEGEEHH